MSTIVKMPQLGETVVEGVVARWLKAPGEQIRKREPLLEITTDKIDTEVPAPADGVLLKILVAEGTTVKAGTALAVIGAAGEAVEAAGTQPETPASARQETPQPAVSTSRPPEAMASNTTHAERSAVLPAGQPAAPDAPNAMGGRAFVSPVVARMVQEHGLDLGQIAGSGLGGRVTKKDVEAYLQRSVEERADAEARLGEASSPEVTPAPALAAPELLPDEVLTPLSAMRRAIAQHMVMSKRTSPHVTTIFEADMTAVVRHREEHKQAFAAAGIALTYTPYWLAAIVAGLKAVPEANSRYLDAGIVINRRIHIGIAVSLSQGLIVPVLRDADEKNLQGLARSVNDLVARTRAGKLALDETRGGSFTLTNHGTGGSLLATPIINQPQTGILGAGAIVKRPIVRSSSNSLLPHADDSIVIRPMCFLSFTFDHRVLDGAQGDQFLTAVKQKLENWE